MRRKDGSTFLCRLIAKAIDPENTQQGTVWIVEDITERRRQADEVARLLREQQDRKSTRLNSSHGYISYAVFCLKKKNTSKNNLRNARQRDHIQRFTHVIHTRDAEQPHAGAVTADEHHPDALTAELISQLKHVSP